MTLCSEAVTEQVKHTSAYVTKNERMNKEAEVVDSSNLDLSLKVQIEAIKIPDDFLFLF